MKEDNVIAEKSFKFGLRIVKLFLHLREKKIEREIAAEDPAADLLKIAHHGSATSTTPELLQAVHPRFAVISVGYRNPFQHPRNVVLKSLQEAKVRTYRTDMLGAISFYLDGKSVTSVVAPR